MIKYRLICAEGHEFDGWFANMAAYDTQKSDGLLVCPQCQSTKISKAVMSPAVPKKANRQDASAKLRHVMQKMTAHVEENFDYVGSDFAEEARKIHYGETEEREIYGEASFEEAKDLLDEGVPVAPLPGVTEKQKN